MIRVSCKFPASSRLKKRREFSAVLTNGRSRAGRTAVVYAHPSTATEHRLGLIVSRRVGGAVVRNRFKRSVREQFRQQCGAFQGIPALDFVVIAKRRAADMPRCVPADLHGLLRAFVQQLTRG